MSIFGWSYPAGCSGPPGEDYDETIVFPSRRVAKTRIPWTCSACRVLRPAGTPKIVTAGVDDDGEFFQTFECDPRDPCPRPSILDDFPY